MFFGRALEASSEIRAQADSDVSLDPARHATAREIVNLVNRSGVSVQSAGWLHDRATGTWRFVLVTPMLRTHGPAWIYDRMLRHPLPAGVTPSDIYVIDPEMAGAVGGLQISP